MLYNLKNDKTIVIKGADKASAIVVWDRKRAKESRKSTWRYQNIWRGPKRR